jgi:Domain of unknown function (DUF1835)
MTDPAQPAQARPRDASGFDPAFRLDLEQQRKRAKELLQAFLAGDDAAAQRFRRHHPALWNGGDTPSRPAKLSDAQLVIAREIGLPSWPRLKAHILAMRGMRDSIEHGAGAPDADMATLHVRCGSDIKSRLAEAGFAGDFLEYSDALCQGPVIDDPAWVDLRATFLAEAYGPGVGRTREQIAEGLARAEADLQVAASRHERIVLWFEHDGYDQINLARCLAQFAETPPRRLEMVTLQHYPGAMRFIGLGQLPPEALRLLWEERKPVTARQAQAGRTAWPLLRQPDPTPLAAAVAGGFPELPYLARALRRHCQELPWTGDGLSLTQRLILEVVAEQPRTIGEIFRELMQERDPLPFLSDLMLADFVKNMQRVSGPVFTATFDDEDRRWFRERLTITPLGRAVLAGDVDWLSLSPPERWVGGVRIRADRACWRWDERRGTTVLQR